MYRESEIIKDDLAEGTIDIEPSYVRVDSIYAVEKEIIRKKLELKGHG